MKKPFEVFNEMIAANDKGFQMAPMANIDSIDVKGSNGYVTFGVPVDVAMRLMQDPSKYLGGFILCDKDAFEKYQKLP